MFVILVGRFIGVVGLVYLLQILRHKKKVNFKQLLFITYAGLIRGAIAFGLVLTIDNHIKNYQVVVTTTLTLVIVTTLLYGSLMPFA